VYSLPFFVVALSARIGAERMGRVLRHVAAGCLAFSLPLLFVVWHLWSIRAVLPDYGRAPMRPDLLVIAWTWFITLITLGNQLYFHYFSPWEALRSHDGGAAMQAFRVLRAFFLAAHYFLIILPFNLFLLVTSVRYYRSLRKGPPEPHATLIQHLLYAAALAAVFSAVSMVNIDIGKLRRILFVVMATLLVVGLEGARAAHPHMTQSRIFRGFFWVAFASMLLIVVYSPRWLAAGRAATLSADNREVIGFIERLPDHPHQRLFFYDMTATDIARHVTFYTLIHHQSGAHSYYFQDPVSTAAMLGAYKEIAGMTPQWRQALERFGIRFLILSKRRQAASSEEDFQKEEKLLQFVRTRGKTVLENGNWVIVRVDGGEAAASAGGQDP
jgi:hypothetical protein